MYMRAEIFGPYAPALNSGLPTALFKSALIVDTDERINAAVKSYFLCIGILDLDLCCAAIMAFLHGTDGEL